MTAPKVNTTTEASSFDPTDLQYQADKSFAPDKESKWTHGKESDGWCHAHNAIRAELQMVQECFLAAQKQAKNSPHISEWQVKSFQKVFDGHYLFVHEHHTNEDNILTPKLTKRIKYPAKLTDDHDGIVKQLENIKQLIHGLKPGNDSEASMRALVKEWKEYSSNLKEHMQEEEDIGLPLMRAYFLPEEYAKITEEIIKGAPKVRKETTPLTTRCPAHIHVLTLASLIVFLSSH